MTTSPSLKMSLNEPRLVTFARRCYHCTDYSIC